MAGLFIKELIARRKLESWRPPTRATWFLKNNLVIARLDKLARNQDVERKLEVPECRWDPAVRDEAHKMSGQFFASEVRFTKSYHLVRLLSGLTRHFLLMTATPHNGKGEDFQLCLALLDSDPFVP